MPPKPKPLSQQEEEDALFDAPLFPDSAPAANDNADKSLEGVDPDDPALFDAPLFPKDVYDPERSPSPPAWEPKDWWDEILGKANEVVSTDEGRAGGWRAALQGASLNTADNLTRWASPSFADSLDAAAKAYPGAHGVGQAFPRTAAAMLGGPSVVSQGMAQSGVSGLASAFDGGSFKDVLGDMGLGALEGSVGTLIGKGVGTVGRAVGDTAAGRWAGRQLGRILPAADDAAHVVPDAAPLKDPFVGRRGELARMPPEPVPSRPPPAPSPPPSTAIGEDEEALIDLLRRKPPRSAMPEYPPPTNNPPTGTWPPDYAPGKTMRGPMGRITKRPQPGGTLEPVPERPPYGPPPAAELPYESPLSPNVPAPSSPGERLLRMDAPEPAPRPATLSEPPLPIPEPPLRAPEQPLDLAFEPGPPRIPRMEAAPYDVPLREGASSAGSAEPGVFSDLIDVASIQTPRGALRGAAAGARLGKRALNALGGPTDASGLATAGRVATGIGWDTGLPDLLNQKVNAQDRQDYAQAPYSEPEPAQERPAVADLPTLHYALQATLASGRAGLSPEDEQALTEAVVQGDQAAISATDFRLRQRYPAYARRVERELRAYNEED